MAWTTLSMRKMNSVYTDGLTHFQMNIAAMLSRDAPVISGVSGQQQRIRLFMIMQFLHRFREKGFDKK